MPETRKVHNIIAANVLVALHTRLRGKRCRPFNSDTKIRIRRAKRRRFYYPDTSVVCRQNPQTDSFQDEPVVICEVVSAKTRRQDEGEKKDAYLTLPSVGLCPHRTGNRRRRRSSPDEARLCPRGGPRLKAVLPFPEIGTELPLAEVYDGVEFSQEQDEDDE